MWTADTRCVTAAAGFLFDIPQAGQYPGEL
jgi:hypothetical protein